MEGAVVADTKINTVAIVGHSTIGVPAAGFGVGIDTGYLISV